MSDKMVLLAIYSNPIEAELVRAELEAEGIRAHVLGTTSGDLFSGMGVGLSNVQLLVPEADYERASALLAEETDVGQESREEREWEEEDDGRESTDIRPVAESPIRADSASTGAPETAEDEKDEVDSAENSEEEEEEREPIAVLWTPDEIAARAFRASIFGFFICPGLLHLYALWLLHRISSTEGKLSSAGERKAFLAFIISIGPGCLPGLMVLAIVVGEIVRLFLNR